MKSKKFFEMSNKELGDALAERKQALFNLRFEHATQQLKNPSELRECRRDIARIKTIQRERSLEISFEPVRAARKGARKK